MRTLVMKIALVIAVLLMMTAVGGTAWYLMNVSVGNQVTCR